MSFPLLSRGAAVSLSCSLLAGLLLTGCSEAPKQEVKKEPPKPAEPVGGREAFFKMYAPARTWAPDIQPMRLRSIDIPEVKSKDGKYGAWEAVFVSESKRMRRTYTYSVVEAGGNLHQGVFQSPEESYAGPTGQAKPFLVAALKTESDAVYETAVGKSKDYIAKNPTMPVTIQLELTQRFPDLAWRVIWGESASSSNYSVFVDATTGAYLATAH